MAFREWLRRELASRPSGSIELELPEHAEAPALAIVLRGLLSLALIGIVTATLLRLVRTPVALGGVLAYLAVALVVRPRPNLANLEPRALSWTDDHDRALLLFRVLLWPGRWVGAGVRDAVTLLVRAPGERRSSPDHQLERGDES